MPSGWGGRLSRRARKGAAVWLALYGLIIFAVFASLLLYSERTQNAGNSRPSAQELAAAPDEMNCHIPIGAQGGDAARVSTHGETSQKREYGEASTVREKPLDDGTRIKTLLFNDILIDRLYPSMTGPAMIHRVLLGDAAEKNVWITTYSAEVLDGNSGQLSQEYLCHASLDLVGTPGTIADKYHRQELTISQGQKEITFPRGFALRFPNDPLVENHVLVMVLNNNDKEIHRKVTFKTTIHYQGDREAARHGLIPLYQTGAALYPPVEGAPSPNEPVVKTATEKEVAKGDDGRMRTGHWLVPPGRQVIAQDVTHSMNIKEDTTIHYMWMHVHPYAESVALRDKTTGQTLWVGKAQNDPDKRRAALVATDAYSSVEGLKVYKDHQYEFVSVYDNPTHHDVDAMASLWVYARSSQQAN